MSNVTKLKNKVLKEYELTKKDAITLLDAPLDELCESANHIRQKFCGNKFDACTIINVKNGICSEDCKFCAQSKYYNKTENYHLLSKKTLKEKSLGIFNKGFERISYVASGKKTSSKDINTLSKIITELKKEEENIKICVSLGLLNLNEISILKDVGVDRIHNNLESSKDYFKKICTTHSYDEKLETINLITNANIMVCSGGIFGMGETFEDRVDLAILLRDLRVKSIPINVLNPIKGTPVENNKILTNEEVCRIVAIFRFINPNAFIRMAGGRSLLYDNGKKAFQSGANAAILGNMLTTTGVKIEEDLKILNELDYEIIY